MDKHSDILAYRINDATRIIGLGRSAIYGLIASGKLKAIKIGGRTLITRTAIEALISEASDNA